MHDVRKLGPHARPDGDGHARAGDEDPVPIVREAEAVHVDLLGAPAFLSAPAGQRRLRAGDGLVVRDDVDGVARVPIPEAAAADAFAEVRVRVLSVNQGLARVVGDGAAGVVPAAAISAVGGKDGCGRCAECKDYGQEKAVKMHGE